jgi:kynureninase
LWPICKNHILSEITDTTPLQTVLSLRPMKSLQDAQALDAQDPLRSLRDLFHLPEGQVYLDGNSLGVLPRATSARVQHALVHEWGVDLIKSWNSAGWFAAPQRVGDLIAPLIGAKAGEVVATDSTSINLFKVLHASILIAGCADNTPASGQKGLKNVLLSERSNFPTDLYMAQALCDQHGLQLKLVGRDEIPQALTSEVAVLMLTHVHYRSGHMHNMAALTQAAHAVGALTVWDLAHSAGAVPVDLHGSDADFAVGCGYKYLNGGPGAPAFVWVHPRHVSRFEQPLSGWWGHAAPFAFTPGYAAASGIARYLCGTQPVLSMTALECGLQVFEAALALGGMTALRKKSLALTDAFMQLVQTQCASFGLQCVTPAQHAQRGSQVSLVCSAAPPVNQPGPEHAYAIVQALIARGVVGDYRAGDVSAPLGEDRLNIMRFGFTPLYTRFADVWQAVQHLHAVLSNKEYLKPEFNQQHAVT